MCLSRFAPRGRSRLRSLAGLSTLLVAGLAGACGGSSRGGGQSGIPGEERSKPDEDGDGFPDGLFFVDPNQSGRASRLHIAPSDPDISPGLFWARLVDVHEIDAAGEVVTEPVFRDFAIEEDIQTDGTSYRLERNPFTQKTRLVILARKTGVPDSSTFDELLRQASDVFPTVSAKNDDGTSAPPFSLVPRNAVLVIRIDDCLDDDQDAQRELENTVLVFTGYPPLIPFTARIVFDPNHGAVVGGEFHSTRVLVDMTISEVESAELPGVPPVNALGLPPSLTTSANPDVSVRIPTQVDFGTGQFEILTNVAGVGLTFDENGPVDVLSPTQDVVRAMRSGNANDPNNGFLVDMDRPQVVGSWGLSVDQAVVDPLGDPFLDFLVDITFPTPCSDAPQVGDVIAVVGLFLEVTQDGAPPDPLVGVHVRASEPVGDPDDLESANALFLSTFDPALALPPACWVSFTPLPTSIPSTGVSTEAQIFVNFSEPMDPESLSPFQQFLVVRGVATPGMSTATSSNVVVGEVLHTNDLRNFNFKSTLPFPHAQTAAETLHVELFGPTDLAGNSLQNELPFVNFTLNPQDPDASNGAVVLRFTSPTEVGGDTKADLRGQFFNDVPRGVIMPRPVSVTGWPADRSNLVPTLMTPLPSGVFTPLTPLGAKLQTVWRYCDVGWNVLDETKYNLDVIGLDWSPVGGQIVADFYENFEIRLGHSRFLPDEAINTTTFLPLYPASGLQGSPNLFSDNYLSGTETTVQNRALGYMINAASLFLASTLTPMMPFPLNRGPGLDTTYTWRDTAILAKAGPNANGIPLDIEFQAGAVPTGTPKVATTANVPTFGLPLLMELRCFPSDTGVGLNLFDVSIANIFSSTPNFRAYSSGGVNTAGQSVIKNPDLEPVPTGGFNPISVPPGQKTRFDAENTFYIGQIDVIVRVSRIHSIWLDTGNAAPSYMEPALEPSDDEQPDGTEIVLDYRGATGFQGTGSGDEFDATRMNAYGDIIVNPGRPLFLNMQSTWTNDIHQMDGARYIQVRISFLNNIQTNLSAELSALAFPFTTD